MSGGRNAYRRQELWAKGHRFCAYCGLRLVIEENRINMMTVDHIVPRALGATSSKSNVTSCCKLCNELKSNRIKMPVFDTKTGQKLTKPTVQEETK